MGLFDGLKDNVRLPRKMTRAPQLANWPRDEFKRVGAVPAARTVIAQVARTCTIASQKRLRGKPDAGSVTEGHGNGDFCTTAC